MRLITVVVLAIGRMGYFRQRRRGWGEDAIEASKHTQTHKQDKHKQQQRALLVVLAGGRLQVAGRADAGTPKASHHLEEKTGQRTTGSSGCIGLSADQLSRVDIVDECRSGR